MGELTDLTGETFGFLKVERFLKPNERIYKGKIDTNRIWECSCKCGRIINVSTNALKTGNTKSCGCYRKEKLKETQFRKTHGKTSTSLYGIWYGIKMRCYNPNQTGYESYGGRGITVCEEWRDDFQAFYDWAIANGYRDGLTIERKDVNGNYEPSNCRWATEKEQARNRRNTIYVNYKGKTVPLSEVSEETGISYGKLYQRVFGMGKSIEESVEMKGYSADKCKHRKQFFNGEEITVSEFCDKYGITDKSFAYRWTYKNKDFEWILQRWNEKENIPDYLVDCEKYAKQIGVTSAHVKRKIREGKLAGEQRGRKWYVIKS